MKKRLLSVVLTLVMLFSLIPVVPAIQVGATTTINIGDYVQMGKYYDEPILWRCVDIDENGPLMLADKILTIKPFDAQGDHKYLDGTAQADTNGYRTSGGSNLWETSNMRSWLNSTATAGNVQWLDGCPPTIEKVYDGKNAYATEKGFLAEGNFTTSEQNAIKSVTQKSLLNGLDVPKLSIGGTAVHTHTVDYNISTIVGNYGTAYYQNVTDKMFLLDVKQINKVYNSGALGTNYYIGKPTQKAVDNSEYKEINLSTENNWYNWLRTPHANTGDSYQVRIIQSNGIVYYSNAYSMYFGARPAFYINLLSVIFVSGNGTVGTPYNVDGTPSTLTKGDVDGDGDIDVSDLVIIKMYLLRLNIFDGVYKIAGDVNNDGDITISDLLVIKKHILGIQLISQAGA